MTCVHYPRCGCVGPADTPTGCSLGKATGDVDVATARILEDHLLVGPRPGQCRCGFGDETMPVKYLGRPHAAHVVEQLRAGGVLKECL